MTFNLIRQSADAFQTFGFVVLRRFFEPSPLAAEIDRVMADGLGANVSSSGDIPKIRAVQMVREIRDRHARRLAGKTPDQIVAFYRMAGMAATQEAKRRTTPKNRLPQRDRACLATPKNRKAS